MIDKDLPALASGWESCRKTVTELSKDKRTGRSLVESEKLLYDFDEICGLLFPEDKKPASADGLEITPREVRLIEFKSGFHKKITRENFDEVEGRCDTTGKVCEKYWKMFSQKQAKETAELLSSIRFKALESYLTLEKLLSSCQDTAPLRLVLIIVADVDAVDGMVDILEDLSKRKQGSRNSLEQIRSSLKKYTQADKRGNIYCYDRIDVLAPSQYASRVNT